MGDAVWLYDVPADSPGEPVGDAVGAEVVALVAFEVDAADCGDECGRVDDEDVAWFHLWGDVDGQAVESAVGLFGGAAELEGLVGCFEFA